MKCISIFNSVYYMRVVFRITYFIVLMLNCLFCQSKTKKYSSVTDLQRIAAGILILNKKDFKKIIYSL